MEQAQPVCPLIKCKRILVAMDRSKYSEKAFDQTILSPILNGGYS
jgi:hypothetical protein